MSHPPSLGVRAWRRSGCRSVRVLLPLVAVVLIGTSCVWTGPRGDARSLGYQPAFHIHPADLDHLVESWTAPIGPFPNTPVIDGRVAIVAGGTSLRAFDAGGCGAPTCVPLWQASAPEPGFGQPVIEDGIVYVPVNSALHAYDVNGVQGCGGAPALCTPLWTAAEETVNVTAGGGVVVTTDWNSASVYAPGDGSACAGTPKVCAPLRHLQTGCFGILFCSTTPASIGDGMIAIGTQWGDEVSHGGAVFVFDVDGSGCTPSPPGPPVCVPDRTHHVGGINGAPAIHDGLVTVQFTGWFFDDHIYQYTYRSHGLWTFDPSTGTVTMAWTTESHQLGDLAVSSGVIFELDYGPTGGIVRAHDAGDGSVLWTASVPGQGTGLSGGGGVLYVATDSGALQTFDVAGEVGCSGTPTVCTSLGSFPSDPNATVALSNGLLWLAGADGTLRVLAKPTS